MKAVVTSLLLVTAFALGVAFAESLFDENVRIIDGKMKQMDKDMKGGTPLKCTDAKCQECLDRCESSSLGGDVMVRRYYRDGNVTYVGPERDPSSFKYKKANARCRAGCFQRFGTPDHNAQKSH